MSHLRASLFVLLALVVAFAAYLKISNPHRKFSRQAFWETATVQDVQTIPAEALAPGNRNGPVLMWAATATRNPAVIEALVARGADVNESDTIDFSGTPLSAAAGMNPEPEIINALVRLGADVHKRVGSNDKSALIIAAELNSEPAVVEALIRHGADPEYRDRTGRNALEQARRFNNSAVVPALEKHSR